MGRPRKPTRLKLIHGSRDRHQNKLEPNPQGVAVAPDWLIDEALTEWERLAPELERLGILTIADEAEFAIYCQAYAELVEAEAKLQENGKTQTTKDGFERKSAWCSIRDEAWKRLHQAASGFGLNPSARAKVEAKPISKEDDKSKYIA
tara:strand:- start:1259 stop:1702 length:444 start_codon:yes stop_codon:yes gene_type:complete